MHGIPDGIPRRDVEFAQEQNRGGGKVFAVPAAGAQQEAAQSSFICARRSRRPLPGAVGEVVLKEFADRSKRLPQVLLRVRFRQMHFRKHLQDGRSLFHYHSSVCAGETRICIGAGGGIN